MNETPMIKIDAEAIVSAFGSATVDPATRKVRIGNALFSPREVKALAETASAVADSVESPTVHRAGDIYIAGHVAFVSDGVVLWRCDKGSSATPEQWASRGIYPTLAYGPGKIPLGQIIRDAIKASL